MLETAADPDPRTALDEVVDSDAASVHGLGVRLATITLLLLLVLTGLTVLVAQVDLGGHLNLIFAVFVACVKAMLVGSVFMHLLWDRGMPVVVVGGCLFGVALFVGLTISDISSRGLLDKRELAVIAPPDVAFQARVNQPEVKSGYELFKGTCASCHGLDGHGLPGLGKDMTRSTFIRSQDDRQLLRFIKMGRLPSDALNTTGVAMPPRGGNPTLNDKKLKEIIAFVRILAPYQGAQEETH